MSHQWSTLTRLGGQNRISARPSPNVNRQSLEPTYVRNGLAYAVRVEAFLRTNSIHGTRARAIDMAKPAISIYTEQELAEARDLIEERDNEPKRD